MTCEQVTIYYSSSIFTAAGTLGNPGIVIIEPVKATTNPAPADNLTSLIVISKSSGAFNTFALSVMDNGVLERQT